MDVQFYENEQKNKTVKIAEWKRSFGIDKNGEIYAPAAIIGVESHAMLAASCDGIKTVIYLQHVFIPLSWMRKECPDHEELYKAIEKSVKKACC